MTSTVNPWGYGDFQPARPRPPNHDDTSPPPSARLAPLQTQAANSWSKSIWNTGGFGAVGRPKGESRYTHSRTTLIPQKDTSDDRRSPSLLSPAGAGPSPWHKTYGLPSPTEPTSSDFVSKASSHLPLKSLPGIHTLSLQTRGLAGESNYSKPSEIQSARPTFGRGNSFVTSPRDAFDTYKPAERQSLAASWDNQASELDVRLSQAPFSAHPSTIPRDFSSYTNGFSSRSALPTSQRQEQTAWASARQPQARDQQPAQRTNSYSSSLQASHVIDTTAELERSFDRLDVADDSYYTPSYTNWANGAELSSDRSINGTRNNSVTQQDDGRASQFTWRTDSIPRSFVPASAIARQQDLSNDARGFQSTQRMPEQRRTTDLAQYRLPVAQQPVDDYERANLIDLQLRSLQQVDRRTLQSMQEQEEYFHHYMQHFLPGHLRGQLFGAYPYALPPLGNPGMSPYMQMAQLPPMMGGPRIQTPDSTSGPRSQLLDEYILSLKSNNRRYELRDIYDHFVEFSGNQYGSKFIQGKLDTATSDEKERVFRELMPNAIQLMKDIYGNYVVQKLFERGDQSQKTALFNVMSGKIYELSCQVYGCRVVQTAFQHVLVHQQASMVEELKSHVLDCVRDQNGNHVIQVVVKHVPTQYIQFVVDAFIGQIQHLATHPYGCRVVQRLLDHCVEPGRALILRELHACSSTLVSDQYGNYVTQHVIEHGLPEDRAKIIAVVRQHLVAYSKQKFASNVVEKCLTHGNDEQRREMMLEVSAKDAAGQSALSLLIKDNFGNYVVQRLLDCLSPPDYAQFVDFLAPEIASLRIIAPNNKQVDNVAKKMYRHHDMPYSSAQYRNSSPHPIRTDITNTAPPLTYDESPYSTSQPSITDDGVAISTINNKDGSLPTGPEIRVTGH